MVFPGGWRGARRTAMDLVGSSLVLSPSLKNERHKHASLFLFLICKSRVAKERGGEEKGKKATKMSSLGTLPPTMKQIRQHTNKAVFYYANQKYERQEEEKEKARR